MNSTSTSEIRRPRLALAARPLMYLAMPVLGVVNQYCAMRTAHILTGVPFDLNWPLRALAVPWLQAWIGFEIVTLAAWMVVLSQLSLSAAFPMTALGYMLVIGLGWIAFGEPISLLQVVGAGAILLGVWLLGDERGAQTLPGEP